MTPFWRDRDPEEVERVFLISTGSRIYFRAHPPYGHWQLSFERGPVPDYLAGSYTNFKELYAKTEHYLRNRRYPADIIEEVTNAP